MIVKFFFFTLKNNSADSITKKQQNYSISFIENITTVFNEKI